MESKGVGVVCKKVRVCGGIVVLCRGVLVLCGRVEVPIHLRIPGGQGSRGRCDALDADG